MTDSAETSLIIERDGAVARLTLNRPASGNAIDIPLAQALMHAAIECDEDPDVRAVLLTGSGKLFCAGGDVGGFAAAGDRAPQHLKELTGYVHSAVSRFARMRKPLVTAINGPAAGAGLSFAILGDFALAARSSHFTLAYSGIGLSPDGAATWFLPRLIGLRLAQEFSLSNRRMGSEEAEAIGLVTRVVDDAALVEETDALLARLVAAPTEALGRTRELLLSGATNTLETHMEIEARTIAEMSRSKHGREGIAAFLGKRKPVFD